MRTPIRSVLAIALFLVLFLLLPWASAAQDVLPPSRGGFTVSMGVPPTWTWAGGFSAGVHGGDASKVTAYGNLGGYRDLMNPMTAALGVRHADCLRR